MQYMCMQLDCSAWQGHIAAALAASPDTPITPSLPLLTALLGARSADEAEGYAQEARALADQVPIGELCVNYLHHLTPLVCCGPGLRTRLVTMT